MKKICFIIAAFLLFSSHDMFLKQDTYFLQSNTIASIQLFNGTFEKSDNTIDRDRMIDASLVGNGNRIRIDTTQWTEKNNKTILNFKTGEAGTWVAGVSTHPRNIEMNAADFNGYLEHDGVVDMLEWRKQNNALDQDAVEKYSKHVKTIFQVGDQRTDDWQTVLGYPIEFIPLSNPYDLHAGDALQVKLLWQGTPLSNQLVYVGSSAAEHEHSHDDDHDHAHANEAEEGHHDHDHEHAEGEAHDHEHTEEAEEDHQHHATTQLRTDANGVLNLEVTAEGEWYLRTIHLILSEETGLTHESNWATLTFEVGHSHGEETHSHGEEQEHENSNNIPTYPFWIGGLVFLGILVYLFRRNRLERL